MTPINNNQMRKKDRRVKTVAKRIENALSFTNGWRIPDEDYTATCETLAKEIVSYLDKKGAIK